MSTEYWQALAEGDRPAAMAVVRSRREAGTPLSEIVRTLVAPAQERIGELWATDQWSVAQEHAATSINEAVVAWLGSFAETASPDAPVLVVACIEHDWHSLPALIVSEHLIAAGYRVNYLGANPSPDSVIRLVLRLKPRAVLLSCSMASSLLHLKRQLRDLRALGLPVIVGGHALGSDGRRALAVGATAFAATPQEAEELLATLPHRVPVEWASVPAPGADDAAYVDENCEQISEHVLLGLRDAWGDEALDTPWFDLLLDHLVHVIGSVAGALVTSDQTVMDDVAAWLATVLTARRADPQVLGDVWRLVGDTVTGRPAVTALVDRARRRTLTLLEGQPPRYEPESPFADLDDPSGGEVGGDLTSR